MNLCIQKDISKIPYTNKEKYKWKKEEEEEVNSYFTAWGNFGLHLKPEKNECNSLAIYFQSDEHDKSYLMYRFEKLYEKWNEDIGFSSSGRVIFESNALQEIIKLGEQVIPLILEKYRVTPHHWSYALSKITGNNPVKKKHCGNLVLMSTDWIEWGKENGYID